jgi:cell wall-associated NlpC family hydrolase
LSALWRVVVAVSVFAPSVVIAAPAHADPIANKQAEAAHLAQQLDNLSLRVSRLSEQLDAARLTVDRLNAKMSATRAGMEATQALLAGARSRVREMAINSYMRGGTAADLGMFVPKSTQELTIRNTYMGTIAASTNNAIDSLRQANAQLGEQESQLAADRAAAAKALAQADSARRAAAAADSAERATLARVQGDLATLVAADQAQRRQALAARVQSDILARQSQRASRGGSASSGRFSSGPLPPPPPGASGAIVAAQRELGVPYVYGGGGPDGFDCSGLTAWAWGHAGHSLPHSAAAQYSVTTHIPIADLQPGDLVFYGSPPHHVGIYVGGGSMINALHSGTNVEYDSIYMEGDIIGGGRVN